MEIIEHTFPSEYKMAHWLGDRANYEALKAKYPPETHNARIDLINKQIIITVLKDPNGEENSSGQQTDAVRPKEDLGDART